MCCHSVEHLGILLGHKRPVHAAQVAASPEATYVSPDDVSPDFVEKETAIEMEKEDILSKPEAIRC